MGKTCNMLAMPWVFQRIEKWACENIFICFSFGVCGAGPRQGGAAPPQEDALKKQIHCVFFRPCILFFVCVLAIPPPLVSGSGGAAKKSTKQWTLSDWLPRSPKGS